MSRPPGHTAVRALAVVALALSVLALATTLQR